MSYSARTSKETAWSSWTFDARTRNYYRARKTREGNWEYEHSPTSALPVTSQYTSKAPRGSNAPIYPTTDEEEEEPSIPQNENNYGSRRQAHFDPDVDTYAGSSNTRPGTSQPLNPADDEGSLEYERDDSHDPRMIYHGGQHQSPGIKTYGSSGGSYINTVAEQLERTRLSGSPFGGDNKSDAQESDNDGSESTSFTDISRPEKSVVISRQSNAALAPGSTDSNYRIHPSREFKWGRVFRVIWAEPGSKDPFDSVHQVRRFVVVKPMGGHCIALPIVNYTSPKPMRLSQQKSHAIIFTSDVPPGPEERETDLLTPIRILPINRRQKLEPTARLNYAKLYTIEHNVKVWFIGQIHPQSEQQLTVDYNSIHKLLPDRRKPTPTDLSGRNYASTSGAMAGYPSSSYSSPQPDYPYAASTSGAMAGYPSSSYSSPQTGYQQHPSNFQSMSASHHVADDDETPSYAQYGYGSQTVNTSSYKLEAEEVPPYAQNSDQPSKYGQQRRR